MAEPNQDDEQARRAQEVEHVVHSTEMEGGAVTAQWRADAAAWVAGEISLEDFGRRTRQRYGVG